MTKMGKMLIIMGLVLVMIGIFVQIFDRIPFLGKLPGDVVIDRGRVKIYFPWVTSLLLSLLMTLVFYLVNRFKNGSGFP